MLQVDDTSKTVMKFNSETGELTCFAPVGEEVLHLTGQSFSSAHAISNAIQEAYRKGSLIGRLNLQRSIECHMDRFNQA